jgi:hypothetical protein
MTATAIVLRHDQEGVAIRAVTWKNPSPLTLTGATVDTGDITVSMETVCIRRMQRRAHDQAPAAQIPPSSEGLPNDTRRLYRARSQVRAPLELQWVQVYLAQVWLACSMASIDTTHIRLLHSVPEIRTAQGLYRLPKTHARHVQPKAMHQRTAAPDQADVPRLIWLSICNDLVRVPACPFPS